MKETLEALNHLNEVAQSEGAKFDLGNKTAGKRLRKVLLDIKTLSHNMRKEVSEIKNAE